ncbi:hypothetical protein J6590_060303 [Homalodisca vitripennis]|nr:hypothetical protein J6590_060303 [Homalodisca vitripennis]
MRFPKQSYDSSTKTRALIKQFEAIGGVWTLAPGTLPRRFEAFARERRKLRNSIYQWWHCIYKKLSCTQSLLVYNQGIKIYTTITRDMPPTLSYKLITCLFSKKPTYAGAKLFNLLPEELKNTLHNN